MKIKRPDQSVTGFTLIKLAHVNIVDLASLIMMLARYDLLVKSVNQHGALQLAWQTKLDLRDSGQSITKGSD